jgi:DNA-binding CsgD family transcriptional regulator
LCHHRTDKLSRQDLVQVLEFCEACLHCPSAEVLHPQIISFAELLGFEFVLYAYQKHAYQSGKTVEFVNLSNPVEWMDEYHANNYLLDDPVRIELELRLARAGSSSSIFWDTYDRPLSAQEQNVIARRTFFGLRYGFSVFDNSVPRSSIFLISFASKHQRVDERCQAMGRIIVSHLNRCRKRLDLLALVDRLTTREKAVARWIVEGKTNWEIAQILSVSKSTVKFHAANIFAKLEVSNRQGAIAILLAVRFLS